MAPQADAATFDTSLWVLGIDGGGSKTTACMAEVSSSGEITSQYFGMSASSNVSSVPWDEATHQFREAVALAKRKASAPDGRIAAAVAALAGSARPEIRKRWLEVLQSLELAQQIEVVTDAEPLFAAGTPENLGVVLISGTGSVAFGRRADGTTTRAGGWGYLLGDQGSGFDIGRAAVGAILESLDRREPLPPYTQELLQMWRLHSPQEIASHVYAASDPRSRVAEVARLVSRYAAQIPGCGELLDRSGDSLAELVVAVATTAGLRGSRFPLAMGGSILVHCHRTRQRVEQALVREGLQAGPISLVTDPVMGCVELARRMALVWSPGS